MRQMNRADRARLAEAVRSCSFSPNVGYYFQLRTLRSLGYAASADVPRAGGVVRLELEEF
jgi:hypothetical protein